MLRSLVTRAITTALLAFVIAVFFNCSIATACLMLGGVWLALSGIRLLSRIASVALVLGLAWFLFLR